MKAATMVLALSLTTLSMAHAPMETVTLKSSDLHRVQAGRLGDRVSGTLTFATAKGDVTVHLNSFHTRPAHDFKLADGREYKVSISALSSGRVSLQDLR
jgi:hypothetical protein